MTNDAAQIGDEINKLNLNSEEGDDENEKIPGIKFVNYRDESQLESVMRLVGKDLSEPYSGKR